MERAYDIEDLKRLMERLRDPAYGCPWDLKQTYQSIALLRSRNVWSLSMR